ncbi:M14 family zinc carboxypeptidase [Leptothrix discophora]|uniref:M14 family zinc carboxypeptidase n=1 Tax=Leptothrix discophora TaxID=89 RepID=A0ABT9G6P7_LEPDI|nr:M14 family zinc carboxypeptidase [Leptothrix discophora]MDP4302081.1 M14 family zinc carboxypeptidase [Leptothrix discophora]
MTTSWHQAWKRWTQPGGWSRPALLPDGGGQPPEPVEWRELQALIELGGPTLQQHHLGNVDFTDPLAPAAGPRRVPLLAFSLGSRKPDAPLVAFFGGVHGLERIGVQVVLAHLRSLLMRLRWDETLQHQLAGMRLVFMPIVNPGGLWLGSRSNPQGIDLMRSAPVEAVDPVAPLVGGHRLGQLLPWYRGPADAAMPVESAALCGLVERESAGRPFVLTLDCHSGFGLADRLWFPWAGSRKPYPHLAELQAFGDILDQSLLHHRYQLEPQSRQYLTHGDLWDHLAQRIAQPAGRVFLPLTLEMGSWLWVRKNPRQLLHRDGLFNPVLDHRRERVLRRHLAGLDFITRAAASWQRWLPADAGAREALQQRALARWYGTGG